VTRLALRRGTVVSVHRPGPVAEVTVDVDGDRRPAISFEETTGAIEVDDEVVVNVAARDLDLGSGGFDIVHVNLTRGCEGGGVPHAHVMKLNYTSLQHAVIPIEERAVKLERPVGRPVAVIAVHGQLPCVAWAAGAGRPGMRVGYVQTSGGALPGELSRTVAELVDRRLLAGHVTAGPAFGGEHESISVAGALHAGFAALEWDAAIAGPGPGILGSATALGHGGMAALDSAHAALALGCPTVIVPRMSSGDERDRHRGLSHHTRTVLDLLLAPALVAWPEGEELHLPREDLEARLARADLDGYAKSGLPAHTMGRTTSEDQLFFASALAGGTVLAQETTT